MQRGLPRKIILTLLLSLACLFIFFIGSCNNGKPEIVVGGGPSGGTFQNFAVELGKLLDQEMIGFQITVKQTGGSVNNLYWVDQGKLDMALVNGEDAFLGQEGQFSTHRPATKNVQALIRLYGTTAQLIVLNNSPYQALNDLKKHRIAIGTNSGSALAAERFFRSVSLWQEITPIYVDYTRGMEELIAGSVDAVWVLAGVPNEAIEVTNRRFPIRLLDLWDEALHSEFFKDYPFYDPVSIPPGTYKRQAKKVITFQSQTLLIANRELNRDFVYRALKILFSEKGLTRMRLEVPVARDLDVKKGLKGGKIPFHPGAVKFLREAFI